MNSLARRLAGLVACLGLAATAAAQNGPIAINGQIGSPTTATPVDWANVFDYAATCASDPNCVPSPAAALPGMMLKQVAFQRDFVPGRTSDGSTFTTGAKDTQDISQWQCAASNNISSKGDIVNAYAAISYDATNGHSWLNLAVERQSNSGSAKLGFWLLQDKAVGCAPKGSAANFTGKHIDGDLLLVADFTSGGSVASIAAYKWQAGQLVLVTSGGGQCGTVSSIFCGQTNTATITPPWYVETATGRTLAAQTFFELQIDMTANGFDKSCFTTFLSNTRQSASVTSTMFDYVQGVNFNSCAATAETSCTAVTTTTDGKSLNWSWTARARNTGSAPLAFQSFSAIDASSTSSVSCSATSAAAQSLQPGSEMTNGYQCTSGPVSSYSTKGTFLFSQLTQATAATSSLASGACVVPAGDISLTANCGGVSLARNSAQTAVELRQTVRFALTVPAGKQAQVIRNVTITPNGGSAITLISGGTLSATGLIQVCDAAGTRLYTAGCSATVYSAGVVAAGETYHFEYAYVPPSVGAATKSSDASVTADIRVDATGYLDGKPYTSSAQPSCPVCWSTSPGP